MTKTSLLLFIAYLVVPTVVFSGEEPNSGSGYIQIKSNNKIRMTVPPTPVSSNLSPKKMGAFNAGIAPTFINKQEKRVKPPSVRVIAEKANVPFIATDNDLKAAKKTLKTNREFAEERLKYLTALKNMKEMEQELGINFRTINAGSITTGNTAISNNKALANFASSTSRRSISDSIQEIYVKSVYGRKKDEKYGQLDDLYAEVQFRGGRIFTFVGDVLPGDLLVARIQQHRLYVRDNLNPDNKKEYVIELKSPSQIKAEYESELIQKRRLIK